MAGTAVVTMSIAISVCAEVRRPTIRVVLRNDANVPSDVVTAAQDSVRAVYDAAGVDITWSGGVPAATVALISGRHVGKLRHPPEVIGFAAGSRARRGKMAYIFMHRVTELSARYRLHSSVILGAVMAHELGHLLLPFDAHSEVGVMRPMLNHDDFRQADLGQLLFTAGQAAQIQSAIETRASF
jgi:hypothetical protein